MLEGYGLTETIAVTSVNLPGQNKLGTVGRPFPGVEVKIAEGRRDPRARPQHHARIPGACPRPPRKSSTRTAGSTPATSASSTPTAISRITDRKKDLIKTTRRQVHRAAGHRGRAEDFERADQPGGGDRRPAQVRLGAGDGGGGGGEEAERRRDLCGSGAASGGAAEDPGSHRPAQRHAALVRDDQAVPASSTATSRRKPAS